MDEAHLVAALRYVALYPVRARLVAHIEDWRWSSVRAHYAGQDDHVVITAPTQGRLLQTVPIGYEGQMNLYA